MWLYETHFLVDDKNTHSTFVNCAVKPKSKYKLLVRATRTSGSYRYIPKIVRVSLQKDARGTLKHML